MRTKLRSKVTLLFMTLGLLLAIPAWALASDLTGSVVDTTAPEGSVTLSPDSSGNIEIRWSVTGNQEGTATFKVYKDWTLSGGTFSGSNPETVTVGPRAGGDPATTGTINGTVSVASTQAASATPFTLQVSAFDITNSNDKGAKLSAGSFSTYSVTVQAASDPCASVSAPAAPVITANPNIADGNSGWYKTIPTVSATSSTSGATISYATEVNGGAKSAYSATAPTLGQGETIVYAKATSATCNKVSESSRTFMVDTIAPSVDPASVVDNAWRNSSLSQAFTASDSGSGLADPTNDASFTLTASAQSANATTPTVVSRTVSDVAGNSTTRSVSALIDLTNPLISGSDIIQTAWRNTPLTANFTASDALSGLANPADASFSLSTSGDSPNATTPVTDSKTVNDNAGNSSTRTISAFVDTVKPTNIAFTGGGLTDGATYDFNEVPAAPTGCTASDALSGFKSCSTDAATKYSTAVGTHTITATAEDNAGNTDTKTLSYTVRSWTLTGLYAPVDYGTITNNVGSIVNTVKNGSTVPLKFELFKKDANSTELTNPAFVNTLTARQVACDYTTSSEDAIEELSSTNGTGVRYDATGGQFIYNWQTPKGASVVGKCYLVGVSTKDGSSTALAKFKLK